MIVAFAQPSRFRFRFRFLLYIIVGALIRPFTLTPVSAISCRFDLLTAYINWL